MKMYGKHVGLEAELEAEDGEQEAHDAVDRRLGRGGGQEHGDGGRRIGVGVGQPGMQRHHRGLEPEADDDEGEGDGHGRRVVVMRQALGQVGHVERAGDDIEEADADQVEGGANGAHHQVAEGRGQGAAVARRAHGNQGVGRQRGHFEEDEEVEGVAGNGDADQAGEAQQVGGVEQWMIVRLDLGLEAAAGVQQRRRAHA
jgi:hypothetical protein